MLEGNTGCHAWDAAFALFEFILNRPEEFRGRRVVELGSGCGLLGMALASPSCAPGWGYSGEGGLAREVVLSDSSEQALANLSHNLRMNGLRPKRILSDDNDDHDSGGEEEVEGYSPYDDLTEDVFVSHLDWGSVAAEAKENRVGALGGFFRGSRSVEQQQDDDDDVDVDADGLVVVGSDITYDDAIIPDLAKVIKHLLSLSPSPSGTSRDRNNKTKTKSSKAYISAVPRNPATLELFEATVKGLGMSIDLVPDVHEEDMKANMIQASSDEEKKKEKRTRKRPCYRFVGSDLQQQARKSVKLYEIRLM
jgi:predicted nicotinamide N-methyase